MCKIFGGKYFSEFSRETSFREFLSVTKLKNTTFNKEKKISSKYLVLLEPRMIDFYLELIFPQDYT